MNILVCGGGGYVGSVLCPMIENAGHKLTIVDNAQNGPLGLFGLNSRFNYYNFNLSNINTRKKYDELCDEADSIIHLAGLVGFPVCESNEDLSFSSNIASLPSLDFTEKVVFASTQSVYGSLSHAVEDGPVEPNSTYAKHKLRAEEHVKDGTILRFATAFGVSPKMRLDLLPHDLMYRAMKDKVIAVYEKEAGRSFIHVKDIAKALLYFAVSKKKGIYNVGNYFNNISKHNLAEYIRALTSCKVIYMDYDKDFEKRDNQVSYKKLKDFYPHFDNMRTVEEGLVELNRFMPIIMAG